MYIFTAINHHLSTFHIMTMFYKLPKCTLVLLSLIIFLFSCTGNENDVSITNTLEDGAQIAKTNDGEFASTLISFSSDNETMTGHLSSFITKNRFFVFQNPQGVEVIPKDGTYEVLYLRHLILLNNLKTGEKFIFIVSKDESTKLLNKLPASYKQNAKQIQGIGLSMTYSSNAARVMACTSSGGLGSNACSNTCCSVSCNSGYYASCSAVCVCQKVPPPDPKE